MALEYVCAGCGALLESADELQERTVRCPRCSVLLYLASPDAPLPRYCHMELGPEPHCVTPERVERPRAHAAPAVDGSPA